MSGHDTAYDLVARRVAALAIRCEHCGECFTDLGAYADHPCEIRYRERRAREPRRHLDCDRHPSRPTAALSPPSLHASAAEARCPGSFAG
jgi:hypothetical protein